VTDVLVAAGVALLVLACAGVLVMRGPLARLHYLSMASLGALLVVVAVIVDEGPSLIGLKALLVGALWTVTTPVLSHATARSVQQRHARRQ
jgi:multicomponent Na+:H+ antiporter subunit G